MFRNAFLLPPLPLPSVLQPSPVPQLTLGRASATKSTLVERSISFLFQTPETGQETPREHARETWFQIPGFLTWVTPLRDTVPGGLHVTRGFINACE